MKNKGFRKALRSFYREIEKGNELHREMEKKHGFKVDDIIKGWKDEEDLSNLKREIYAFDSSRDQSYVDYLHPKIIQCLK